MSSKPDLTPSLSVIIPLYQEEDNVAPMLTLIHEALAKVDFRWELICVDDGSSDATARLLVEQARHYGTYVRIIRLSRNYGQTAAMQAGIDAAQGEFIATLDSDLQNDPHDIPRMLHELIERDLDLLAGWRQQRQDPLWLRRFPSRIANRLIVKVTGVKLHDYGCSLKLYRSSVLRKIRLFGEMHRFIPVWLASVTSPTRIGETVVNHSPRQHGQSKYGLSRSYRVLLDLLAVFFFLRFRSRPGHFFGAIGLLFGLLGSVIMTYLVVVKFGLGQDIGGRPLFFISILLLITSVQFLTTGVLAELLSRTFFESTHSTAYSLAKEPDPHVAWFQPDAFCGNNKKYFKNK